MGREEELFMTGMFLFMRGKCQPKQWRQEEWEVKISTIELLPEVKERLLRNLQFQLLCLHWMKS